MTKSEHAHMHSQIVELIPALWAFARRFHPVATDADDLVQETLAKALGNLDRFEAGSSLKSWMFTIMRNTFCTRFKLAKREAPGAKENIAPVSAVEPSQEAALELAEVSKALDRLPSNQRDILIDIVLRGDSYEEAAARNGCAVGTIKSRLNRARHNLSTNLGLVDERNSASITGTQ